MSIITRIFSALVRFILFSILLVVLVLVFAWWLFPREKVLQLPEQFLKKTWPQYAWQISGVQFEPPFSLRFEGIRATKTAGSGTQGKDIIIDWLALRPNLRALVEKKELLSDFQLKAIAGSAHGTFALPLQKPLDTCQVQIIFDDMTVEKLFFVQDNLQRQVKGQLFASLSFNYSLSQQRVQNLQGPINIQKGEVPLRRPIFGHALLPFENISMHLMQVGSLLKVQNGQVKSPLFTGQCDGTVETARPFAASAVHIQCNLAPLTEFYTSIPNPNSLQALRLRRSEQPVEVKLSGTLNDPSFTLDQDAAQLEQLEREMSARP